MGLLLHIKLSDLKVFAFLLSCIVSVCVI